MYQNKKGWKKNVQHTLENIRLLTVLWFFSLYLYRKPWRWWDWAPSCTGSRGSSNVSFTLSSSCLSTWQSSASKLGIKDEFSTTLTCLCFLCFCCFTSWPSSPFASWSVRFSAKVRFYLAPSRRKCLTLSQMTNFRLFQTERVCRRQFRIGWKWQKVLETDRKHCGKRRNCSLWAISPFPAGFSKDLYCRHVKTRACLGKG